MSRGSHLKIGREEHSEAKRTSQERAIKSEPGSHLKKRHWEWDNKVSMEEMLTNQERTFKSEPGSHLKNDGERTFWRLYGGQASQSEISS